MGWITFWDKGPTEPTVPGRVIFGEAPRTPVAVPAPVPPPLIDPDVGLDPEPDFGITEPEPIPVEVQLDALDPKWREDVSVLLTLLKRPTDPEFRIALAQKMEYPGDVEDSSSLDSYLRDIILKGIQQGVNPLPPYSEEQLAEFENQNKVIRDLYLKKTK